MAELSRIAVNLHLLRESVRPRGTVHAFSRIIGRSCHASGGLHKVTNMQNTGYGLRVSVNAPYEEALARAMSALSEQGFGVLTTIDVQQTLKTKLGREFRKYVILGACNPPLADRALHAELEVGLLLPCNVIVYELGPSTTVVSAMAPLAALGIVGDNPALAEVAREADQRLRNALSQLDRTQPELQLTPRDDDSETSFHV